MLIKNLFDLYRQLLRIEKKFTLISILTTVTPTVNLLLAIGLLIYTESVLALAYAFAIANGISITIVIKALGWPKFQGIQFREMMRQIRFGLPIMLLPLMFQLIKGVDQIMIVTFLNPKDLVYYGIALSIQELIYLIPATLGYTLVPYLVEAYGRTDSAAETSHMFEKPTSLISLFSAFSLISAYYLFINLF